MAKDGMKERDGSMERWHEGRDMARTVQWIERARQVLHFVIISSSHRCRALLTYRPAPPSYLFFNLIELLFFLYFDLS
jgi:hypothetical protein